MSEHVTLIPAGTAVRYAIAATGTLVADAPVWITRDGEGIDHILHPGEPLALEPSDRLVVEPWLAGQAARLRIVATPTAADAADLATLVTDLLTGSWRVLRKMRIRARAYPAMLTGGAP